MGHWVERKALDGIAVGVLEHSFELIGPDDDTFVCASGREFFPIPRIGHSVDGFFVTTEGFKEIAIDGFVD